MKSRSQQSNVHDVVPDNGKCIRHGVDTLEQSKRSIVTVKIEMDVDVPPLPPVFSSSKASASLTRGSIDVGEKKMIATLKSGTCSVATSIRRSARVPKTTVTKKGQSIKHLLCSPLSRTLHHHVPPTTSIKATVPTNHYDVGDFSPHCVKKKMRRRATCLRNKKGRQQPATSRLCPNSNKKLPLSKVKGIVHEASCDGTTDESGMKSNSSAVKKLDTKTELPSIQAVAATTQYNCAAEATMKKSKIAAVHTVHPTTGYRHYDNRITPDESVLFEQSSDFWDNFLIETYRHIASNNPDVPDFEPIPYQELARGIPVEVERSVSFVSDSHNDVIDNSAFACTNASAANSPTNVVVVPPKIEAKPNVKLQIRGVKGHGKSPQSMNTLSGLDERDYHDEGSEHEQSKEPKRPVGPDSWQMDVINRMIFYLDYEPSCPYKTYSMQFRVIAEHCTKLHNEGNTKCRHLPGAVFEQLVHAVGGSTFSSIYNAAKSLPYGRLDRGHAVASAVSSIIEPPDLMQLAVGYGYCMAKLITFKGRVVCPDLSGNHSIQYAAEIGSQTVLNMSMETRLSFWNECIMNHGQK